MISDNKSHTKKGLIILGLIIASGSANAGLYIDNGSMESLNQNNSERVYGKDTEVGKTNQQKAKHYHKQSVSQAKMKKNINQKPSPGYLMNNTEADSDEVIFGGQSDSNYNVTQLGAPTTSNIDVLDGFANDVPLLVALKQVVPEGWKATKKGNVDLEQTVSWGGNRPWTYVLSDLAESYHFDAQVDWNNKIVQVMPTKGSKVATHKTDKTAGDLKEVVNANEAKREWVGHSLKPKETQVKNSHMVSSIDNWVLDPDLTLRQNIENWAKEAGWDVSWGAVDYPVVAQTVLHGKFSEKGGPLHQIVMAYRDSEQPIAIKTHSGNKVVRVSNIKYSTPTHDRANISNLKQRR